MSERNLLTALQISDTHIGENIAGEEFHGLAAQVPRLHAMFRPLEGLPGQHYKWPGRTR